MTHADEASQRLLAGSPYEGYVYGYPHKTAYRPLAAPVALAALWAREPDRAALSLYVHVPFCEMRCGFCNLFTQARPADELADRYVAQLAAQAARVASALGPGARFAHAAIGGGTPTQLSPANLAAVLDIAEGVAGAPLSRVPCSVETSPETAAPEQIALLRARGVARVSVGVQSFFADETRAINRPQDPVVVRRGLAALRDAGFPTLNIDLMYGLPGQSVARVLASVREALAYQPEELYLYPLYVRPLTAMGRRAARAFDDERLAGYRAARDELAARGYAQVSMRMFRRASTAAALTDTGPALAPAGVYRCQDDGMVGLGCGARSYTRGLHYSSEWAVGARSVREILAAYVARDAGSFELADYGIALDRDEQARRFALLSLLSDEGLDRDAYAARFGRDPLADEPLLGQLSPLGLAEQTARRLALTPAGVERSDAIGPALYSPRVRALMAGFALR